MELLSEDPLIIVKYHLDIASLVAFSMVSRRFRNLMLPDKPWRGLFFAKSCVENGYRNLLELARSSGLVLTPMLQFHTSDNLIDMLPEDHDSFMLNIAGAARKVYDMLRSGEFLDFVPIEERTKALSSLPYKLETMISLAKEQEKKVKSNYS